MARVTRTIGLVIACEANCNAHTAMLHIAEVSHQETASPATPETDVVRQASRHSDLGPVLTVAFMRRKGAK